MVFQKGQTAWNKGIVGEKSTSFGKHHSEETRKKLSALRKGMPGHLPSPETKRKMSEAHKGHPVSEETKEKFRGENNHFYGKHHTEDARRKISESRQGKRTGKDNPFYGKHHPPEILAKISEANKGENNPWYGTGGPMKGRTLDKNPAWKGGISFEPYCPKFNNGFKEYVRDRFGHTCFLCNSSELSEKSHIHHIDYNKNSICKGRDWAFVPLCRSCHMKTNANRWHWFNLLINYWALNPDINFSAVEGWQYHGMIKRSKTKCAKRETMA
ncbi:NUMOD3 domain-containing DNA-binding protein [Candidatus Pacearchaeota archaeon]|nr:NUMOD3 domain-containing DNA-binding protein [Candidatus Pacearchaeota archaeon]